MNIEQLMTTAEVLGHDPLMTSDEVAELFRVDSKTVTRWAKAGRIDSIKTPGGQLRFRQSEVRRRLAGA